MTEQVMDCVCMPGQSGELRNIDTAAEWYALVTEHLDHIKQDLGEHVHRQLLHLAAVASGWGAQRLVDLTKGESR